MPKNPNIENIDELLSDFSRFYILMLLYESPDHGYSIMRQFKKRFQKEISPSLVYPFLQQLEEKSIVKHSIEQTGEKKRKIFELTNSGKDLCSCLFKRFASLISIVLEHSLSICAHCGCKVYDGSYHEVIDGKDLVFCCIYCAASYRQCKKSSKQ